MTCIVYIHNTGREILMGFDRVKHGQGVRNYILTVSNTVKVYETISWPCQTRSRWTKLYLYRITGRIIGRITSRSLSGSPAGRCPDHWPDNQPVAVRITCSWITGSLIHRVPVRKDVRITGRITIRIVILYCFSSLPVTMLSVVTGSDGNSFHALKNVVL